MRIGGSLEQSLNQGYRLDLKGVIQEGWQQTRRTGFGLLLAIVGVFCVTRAQGLILKNYKSWA